MDNSLKKKISFFFKINILFIYSRIFNYLKYKIFTKKPIIKLKKYSPQIACLILTQRCNLTCSFCSVGNKLNHKDWRDKEADLEKVKRIMKNPLFKKVLGVDLIGGEPLLNKEIFSIIKYLSKNNYFTNINTNGLRLTDCISELKKSGLSRISISLYDDNEDYLSKNLKFINEIFPVNTSVVLFKKDLSEFEKFLKKVKFLKEAGCLSLDVMIYRPQGSNPDISQIIYEDSEEFYKFKKIINDTYPNFVTWAKGVDKKYNKRCPQLWQRITVNMQGKMDICCGTEEVLQGKNSNFFENYYNPEGIINHPTLVNLRKKLIDKNSEPPEMCKNCNLLNESGW